MSFIFNQVIYYVTSQTTELGSSASLSMIFDLSEFVIIKVRQIQCMRKRKSEIKRVNLIKVRDKQNIQMSIIFITQNIILKLSQLTQNMSYSKLKSPYASTSKLQTYKPQYAIPHVVRMQNLLEQYDRENSYLNKQVMELLGRKKQFDSQFGLSNRTLEQFSSKNKNFQIENIRAQAMSKYPSNRQSSSQKLKRYEYVDSNDQTKSPIYQAKVRHTFETSARKQTRHYSYTPYQNIQEIERPINEYKNSYRNSSNGDSNRRAKINYLEEKNSSMNMKVRDNSVKSPYIKPFLPVQQQVARRNSGNRPSKNKDEPEATSRFVNEEQIKNQRKMSSPAFHHQINSTIINKQPYIGKPVEPDSSPSVTESPQKRKSIQNINDSMISLKSNKSRKSGIEVTSAEKSKQRQKKQEQIKIKEKQVTLKLREQQIDRQKQRQIQKQKEIEKQIQKQKEKLLQRDLLRERQRSMQIQRQIQIEKQKQKQKQALQERQKQLQKERQRTKEKEKQLLLLRQKQEQRESGKAISPTKKQKTVTFADRTSYSPQIIIKPIQNQQNLVQPKHLSYASQKQVQTAERHLQQYQNYRPFPNYVPLVTTLPFGQVNSYFTSIIPNSNPFINNSHILPENAHQIQIPKRYPSQEIQEQNPLGRKKSSQHKIEPSQKITYDQGGQNLPRKQSVGSLRANSRDKKKKYIKVISNDMIGSKIGQGFKK